jgi:sugar phosphate isomerase/epimerase
VRLGVVTTAVAGFDFEAGLDALQALGVRSIEVPCAGYVMTRQFGDPGDLLSNPSNLATWLERLAEREFEISALALHGQPLTPDPEASSLYKKQFRQACELAEAAGVDRLTLLAGLPEAADGDRAPCWITSPHPPGSADRLEWQWGRRVIPYWRQQSEIAESHGCRLCFEMHPGDVVYNPASLLRLRSAIGPVIGCNFDPSHLFWQGIDPLEALRTLGDIVYHVHAKDTELHPHNVRLNGVLDPTPLANLPDRSWSFRTVGYGNGEGFWRSFVSTLVLIGYDDVLSIEHEDDYVNGLDGLSKAVKLLTSVVLAPPNGTGRSVNVPARQPQHQSFG